MSLTPSETVSLPLSNVRTLLGDCDTFQSLMDASTAAQAKANTYYIETDQVIDGEESTEAALPRCIVSYGVGTFRAERVTTGGWNVTGPVIAAIEVAVPAEYLNDYQQSLLWWTNQLGALLREMMTLGTPGAGYIGLEEIGLESFGRVDPTHNNGVSYFGALFEFVWRGI